MDEPAERLVELELLYRTRISELCRVAAAASGSRESARDLVQEAFARAVRELPGFRGEGSLEGWLWRIVTNVALNSRRSRAALPVGRLDEDVADGSTDANDPHGVAQLIKALPERQRLVLFLRYYADLDYDTIAEALHISAGTVGATLTAARSTLLEALSSKEAKR
jgi:RNA polymerase sigma-70 factor, ECF subfamily